ncbi:MAG: DUF3276 family protein [Treponema sp.]|nr:DUF3276 family protein [Treponema sp.]
MGMRGELYTTEVILDNRSYFFNVKENRNKDVFLQIVESKIKDGQDDRRAIVVFADDMQKFFTGMENALSFIEKDRKEKAKARAEKKAAKEAKYGKGENSDAEGKAPQKKIYRRKGESRLVAERKAEKQSPNANIPTSGRVIHVTSKKASSTQPEEF